MRKDMKKGDTLIEVILAFSVFSAAMMGGLWLMNNAMARAQGTLQLTMARNAMDGQAEMLRYLNASDIAMRANGNNNAGWSQVMDDARIKTSASDLSTCPVSDGDNFPDRAFVINPKNASVVAAPDVLMAADTYPRLNYGVVDTNAIDAGENDNISESRGLWIEAVRENDSSNFVDFHIRACWIAPGQGAPTTLGTIVRLYVAN